MRPINVINAIILGSCIAISISLLAVWILLSLVSMDPELTERVTYELGVIPLHLVIFIFLSIISFFAFRTCQKRSLYWQWWQTGLWFSLSLVTIFYYYSMTA